MYRVAAVWKSGTAMSDCSNKLPPFKVPTSIGSLILCSRRKSLGHFVGDGGQRDDMWLRQMTIDDCHILPYMLSSCYLHGVHNSKVNECAWTARPSCPRFGGQIKFVCMVPAYKYFCTHRLPRMRLWLVWTRMPYEGINLEVLQQNRLTGLRRLQFKKAPPNSLFGVGAPRLPVAHRSAWSKLRADSISG